MDFKPPEQAKRYFHPRPRQHRLAAFSVRFGLAFLTTAILGQVVLAVLIAPLFAATAIFSAILAIPLGLLSVLHPELHVKPGGVTLIPMFGRIDTIAWPDVIGVVDHPFVYNDPLVGKRLHGKNYRERRGFVVIVRNEAGLGLWYRVVAQVAGVPGRSGFAVSSTTHADYAELEGLFAGFGRVVGS